MVFLAGVLLASACSLGDPADAGSINLYLAVDKSTLATGDSMEITVTARNVGFDPVTLTGPSDCLLYVEIVDGRNNVIWHSNGNCPGPNVTEELVAGQDKVKVITWYGVNLAGSRPLGGYYSVRGVARVTGGAYIGPTLTIAVE
jgi:hypothetical protein